MDTSRPGSPFLEAPERQIFAPSDRGCRLVARIAAAARSETLRDVARRAVNDRAALARDLRNPANARDFVRSAARHPAVRELASAGLMFLPARYLPLGWAATWAATWAAHWALRRYIDPPSEMLDRSAFGASRPLSIDTTT